MTGIIARGSVIFWTDYQFENGNRADKFFIFLGCATGKNYLAVIATSQKKRRDYDPGCHAEEGYYFIPGGKKDWFDKDTWVLLEPYEFDVAQLVKAGLTKEARIVCNLRPELANAICNCLKRCEDVSAHHLSLL